MTNLSPGENLLLLIDAYNVEDQKHRKNFRKKNYNNPFFDDYAEVLEAIQQRNPKADLHGFFYHLGFLRTNGTLFDLREKEYLEKQFEAFEIDVPEWVKNCFDEIDLRTSFVDKFLNEKQYEWKQKQVKEYKEELEQELQEFTLNTSTSRSEFLKEKFNSNSEEIKQTESRFWKVYKYDVSQFYKNYQFKATKEDLNNLFFHSEKEIGTINEIWNIHKLLKKYFDSKNQLRILKEVISFNFPQVQKKTKPVEENIWFQVGLTFATGKAQELLNKYKTGNGEYVKGHFKKITLELGFKPTDRPLFSDTFGNNNKSSNNNIYSQPEKLLHIFEYCVNNNLTVVEDFKEQLPKENNLL